MDFSGLFEMQIMLFMIILLGVFLRKCGLITAEGKNMISNLVINVTLPASILKSFQVEMTQEIFQSCLEVIVVAILIQIGSFVLGLFLFNRYEDRRKQVLQYMTICSNAGVLGNAIAEGIFGAMGLLYGSIYVIPQRTFMWSVGLTYFTEAPDWKTLLKKVLTHPCIVAVILGFPIMIFQIPIPGFLSQTIKTVADSNTFLAMLLIGTILAQVNIREIADKNVWYYSAVRLILVPALVLIACRIAGIDILVTGVCVVLSGMPAASSTVALASKYQKDEIFATKCVVFSTLLSMISVPLWCIVMGS